MKYICFCCLFLLLASPVAWGNGNELLVGVKPAPPFIKVDKDGEITGFSADLIQDLAGRLVPPRTVRFHLDPDVPSHLASVREGRVDLGIAATTITSERLKEIDFSQPYFKADLGVLIQNHKSKTEILVDFLLSRGFMLIFFGVVSFIFLAGNLIWFIERNKQFSPNYVKGVVQGMWWTIVTVATLGRGDLYPKNTIGKLIAIAMILGGVILFIVATASLTSMLTVQQLHGAITTPRDLFTQPVAVVENTNTVNILVRMGMKWNNQKLAATLEEAFDLLKKGKVQAVVHDRPMLQYLIRNQKHSRFVILDQGFGSAYYGILFPPGSPLKKTFDILLLESLEGKGDSRYYQFIRRWFGNTSGLSRQEVHR